MKVTNEALEVINEALKRTNKDYCHVGLISRCHGNKSLDMRLIDKEDVTNLVDLGNVVLDMTEDAVEFLKDFTMTREGNGILLVPPEGWQPPHHECCGGHGHCHDENENCDCDCSEEGCCCNN